MNTTVSSDTPTTAKALYDQRHEHRQRAYEQLRSSLDADDGAKTALVDEIEQNLRLFHSGNRVVEIRILNVRNHGRPHTIAGYFDDLRLASETAVDAEIRYRCDGIYFTLNEVDPATFYRSPNQLTSYLDRTTSDQDIVNRHWLPVDIDVKRPSGISTTADELEDSFQAAKLLATEFFPQRGFDDPVFGGSGNGFHLLYAIDLPNTTESRDIVKALLQKANDWLISNFQSSTRPVEVDPTLSNAARIVRLYGTKARKGVHSAERPHRRSFLDTDFRFSAQNGGNQ